MTVPITYTPNAYYANGATTVFPYGFKVFDTSHLAVVVDSVRLTETTDYTVSGAGTDAGGDVTFLVAPTNGAYVELYRAVPVRRDTDYQTNGELAAVDLNQDLDLLWQALQEAITTGTILTPQEFGAAIGGVTVFALTANGVYVTNLLVKGYNAVQIATPAISAGTLTLDMTSGSYFKVAHNANITSIVLSNILASNSTSFILDLTQDGTGGRTIAWPASVICAGGSKAATLAPNTSANARNLYTFVTPDAGVTWVVSIAKDCKV